MRTPLVAANWKMNGSLAANGAWLSAFAAARDAAARAAQAATCEVVVCAPFVYLPQLVAGLVGSGAQAGAQNLSEHAAGAYTGEIDGAMLADLGVSWVIVGHSERRALYGDSDAVVAAKAARALALGLKPIACVGETLAEREAGRTLGVIEAQLDALLARASVAGLAQGAIAYEPVWAIGTGRTATPAQAQEVHAAIRRRLAAADAAAAAQLRLLYGGSVKPANAGELFAQPDIDGGLIGGASLLAADFLTICAAAEPGARR